MFRQFKMKREQLDDIAVAGARLGQHLPEQFKGPGKLGLGIGRDGAVGQQADDPGAKQQVAVGNRCRILNSWK